MYYRFILHVITTIGLFIVTYYYFNISTSYLKIMYALLKKYNNV